MKKTYPKGKDKFVREQEWHRERDAIVQGKYSLEGSNLFRGCYLGCSIRSMEKLEKVYLGVYNDHELISNYLNIPLWLSRLSESIFEGMSEEDCKNWPVDFAKAIPEGIETKRIEELLNPVKIWIIESTYKNHSDEKILKACREVVEALKGGDEKDILAARSAADAASPEDDAADSAANSAANAADAAYCAANAARFAACSAADSAANADDADDFARFYNDLGIKIIELLKSV